MTTILPKVPSDYPGDIEHLHRLCEDCSAAEGRILQRKIRSGKHILEILTFTPTDQVLDVLADYCYELESLVRAHAEVAALFAGAVHASDVERQQLHARHVALINELRATRRRVAA